MAKTFEERVEEVLGELHGMAWPLLEEPQKRKVTGIIAAGVDSYGDSVRAWGRALKVAESTLRDRLEHYRRSEPIDGLRAAQKTLTNKIAATKNVLQDEALVDRLLDDPKAARALAKAAQRHESRVEAVVRREQRERAPELSERADFNEAAGELLRARRAAQKSLEIARSARFKKDEREALVDDVVKLANVAAFYETFLNGETVDWDEALSELEG